MRCECPSCLEMAVQRTEIQPVGTPTVCSKCEGSGRCSDCEDGFCFTCLDSEICMDCGGLGVLFY